MRGSIVPTEASGDEFLQLCEAPNGASAWTRQRLNLPLRASLCLGVVGLLPFIVSAAALRRSARIAALPALSSGRQQERSAVQESFQLITVQKPVQCPGSVEVAGIGDLHLVNSRHEPGLDILDQVYVENGEVALHMNGRAYFADRCTDGRYMNEDYASMLLLGKTVQYTVDLSGAGCGCNVAFYFTSMKQNSDPSKCEDYYCDANSVCGVKCPEVDVMEANERVWRSTLHMAEDEVGGASGFGGTGPHQQTWTSKEYGPGSACINTLKPFEVHAHFPVQNGQFQGMMLDLKQEGSSCPGLTASVGWYHFEHKDVLKKMGEVLKEGMVPIVSYWKSDDMSWMDGQDVNGENPCPADMPLDCPLLGPRMWNMQVRDFAGGIHDSTMDIQPTKAPAKAKEAIATSSHAEVWDLADDFGDSLAVSQAADAPDDSELSVRAFGAEMATDEDVWASQAQEEAASDLVPPQLASAGWVQAHSEGESYYYNTLTQQTSWELPTAAA